MLEPDSTRVSAETLALPFAASDPPLAFVEFAQPCPAAPLFAHGHGAPEPSPKHSAVPVEHGAIVFCRMQPFVIVHTVGQSANVPLTRTWSPSWKLPVLLTK